MTIASTSDKKAIRPDSVKNWRMSPILLDPNVLRIPTSLALFNELAVDKFIKLTAANSIKNTAIKESMYTF